LIVALTPLRISFCGGGSDFFDFYSRHLAKVCSVTINKYVYVIVNQRYDDKIYVNYTKKEIVNSIEDIQHELVRECLKKVGIAKGIEITTLSDIPSEGSGLGSSSSLVVCLLNAFYNFVGNPQTKETLAIEANEIEICNCNRPMGIQDAFAASYGDLRSYTFGVKRSEGLPFVYDHGERFSTIEKKPKVNEKMLHNFKEHLMLIWTGTTRKSSEVLEEQKKRTANLENDHFLNEMVSMVDVFINHLERGEFDHCGLLFHEAWKLKKNISSNISNCQIDTIYDGLLRLGALGAKVCGAGNGGFILAYVPPAHQTVVRNYVSVMELREMPFDFDRMGTRILLNNPASPW